MRRIHFFSGWLLMLCLAETAGICMARYETKVQKTMTVHTQTDSRIDFTAEDLQKTADGYELQYSVKNVSDAETLYGICVRASLGIEDADNLEITLKQGEAVYRGSAEAIEDGSVLAQQFGAGWIYRFYKEGKECSWKMEAGKKDAQDDGTLTFSWKKDEAQQAYVPQYISHLNIAAFEMDESGRQYFAEQSVDEYLEMADNEDSWSGQFLTADEQSVQLADWVMPENTVEESTEVAEPAESTDAAEMEEAESTELTAVAEPAESEAVEKTVTFELPEGTEDALSVTVEDASAAYLDASVQKQDNKAVLTLIATEAAKQLTEAQTVKMTISGGTDSAAVRMRLIPYEVDEKLEEKGTVSERKSSLLAVYMSHRNDDSLCRGKVLDSNGDAWNCVRYSLDLGKSWITAWDAEFVFTDKEDWNGLVLLDVSVGKEEKEPVTVKMNRSISVSELPDSGVLQNRFLLRGYERKRDKQFTLNTKWKEFDLSYKIQKMQKASEEELLQAQKNGDEIDQLKWTDLTEKETAAFIVSQKDDTWTISIPEPDSGSRPQAGSYRLIWRWKKGDETVYERRIEFFVEYERLT